MMPAITEHAMKRFAPNANPDIVKGLLISDADEILISGGIDNCLKLAHFMGQALIETGGFRTLTENLNYSASRLIAVWPRKFNEENASQYANNPGKIANFVYGGRMGNKTAIDGWRYRGSGILMLTGRQNFTLMTKKTGIDLVNNPDLARDPFTALKVAVSIWKALGCNEAAQRDECDIVTRLINGGMIGAAEREDATDLAKTIFTTDPETTQYTDNNIASLISKTSYDVSTVARASGPSISPRQAVALQAILKAKNYSIEVDGNLSNPQTVGAIAALQKQAGLPITGEIDDDTEDEIQNADNKNVSVTRANESHDSLRAKGSETIKASDSANAVTHGVTASGVGLVGASFGTICSLVQDQAATLKQTTDVIPGLTERITSVVETHMSLLILFILGFALLYIARTLYTNHKIIVSERVRKSANGEDLSH